jgi:MRG-binding protein
MHKHFRMVAISEFMKSQGYAPSDAEHTRIPGIWKKLGNLYNLPALDERVCDAPLALGRSLILMIE